MLNFLRKKQPTATPTVTPTIGCKNSYADLTKGKTALNVPAYRKTKASDPDKYADSIKADNATIKGKWIKSANVYEYFQAVTYSCIKGTKCSNGWAYYVGGKKNVTFEDCVFESIKGINFVDCKNVTIRNCIFEDTPCAVHLKNCDEVTIENCTAECNTTGIWELCVFYIGGGCKNVTVRNCKAISTTCASKAFRVGNDGMTAANIVFEDCEVEGSFASAGFVLGKAGTAVAPVRFSRISANLYNSKASVDKNLNAAGKPVSIWYCNGTSYGAMDGCTTHMDYERTRVSSRMSQRNCSYDLGGRK